LRAALWRYGETHERLSRQQSAAARIGDHLPEVKALLDRVTLRHPSERLSPRTEAERGAAAAVGTGALEVKALLDRVTSTLRQVETLAHGPQQALALAVRQASRTAVQTALSLLPAPIQTPVRLALRATEMALGLGRDLGL
jgi:hypothetical protein